MQQEQSLEEKAPHWQILKPASLQIDMDELKQQLGLKDGKLWHEAQEAAAECSHDIDAHALYKASYVKEKRAASVCIDSVLFESRILRKNLDAVERVFPFIMTIGDGLQQKAIRSNDLMKKFTLDVIANLALEALRNFLLEHLKHRFALKGMSSMSPGSLADWPLDQQRPLFSLFETNGALPIPVTLNSHLMMVPAKSISGIYFPTEIPFFSCQLCPRKACPGRKAPYSEDAGRTYGV